MKERERGRKIETGRHKDTKGRMRETENLKEM